MINLDRPRVDIIAGSKDETVKSLNFNMLYLSGKLIDLCGRKHPRRHELPLLDKFIYL